MENGALLTSGIYWVISVGILAFLLAVMWKVFTKAGKPGWGAIIPIYNIVLLCDIAGKPGWWVLFYFIPLLDIVIGIIVSIGVAKNFGKGAGFGLGLAFGSADYTG